MNKYIIRRERKLQKISRQKYFKAIIILIVFLNFFAILFVCFPLFKSEKKMNNENIFTSNIVVDIQKRSSSFTLTIKSEENIDSIFKNLDLRLKSSSLNLSFPISQIYHNKTGQQVMVSVFPPLNTLYHIYLAIENNIFFSSSIKIENPLTMTTENNLYNNANSQKVDKEKVFTSMFCVGNNYLERWCRMENVCISKDSLIVFSPYKVKFEPIFIVPGCRPPPFDPQDHRFTSKNIKVLNDSSSFTFEEKSAQITSRFYNIRMLWHNVMDFLLPTYWTMTSHMANITNNDWGSNNNDYGKNINLSNEIFIYDNDGKNSLFFIKLLSNNDVFLSSSLASSASKSLSSSNQKNYRCFKEAAIGLRKTEQNPTIDRRQRDSLTLKYQIDPKGVSGLRKLILNKTNGNESCSPSIDRPIVVIIQRKTKSEVRRLINNDMVVNATREMCPFCDVQEVDLQIYNKYEQINFICNVSLLIGIHGSGLIHGTWMAPSSEERPTGVVEFIPFRYTCREWYKQMCEITRIQYFPIHTLSINQSRWAVGHNSTKVIRCQTQDGECERGRCHDFLRDQSIIVDINQYKTIMKAYFTKLKKSRDSNRRN